MTTVYTRAAKGSALTWTEGDANITNLNNDKIEAVVDDTTPQLGGNLDVNGQSIISASNGNISITPNGTGSIVLDGQNWPQADGTNGQVLTTNGSGQLSWTTVSGGGGDIVNDTTPQLGGDLDVQSHKIITSDISGQVRIDAAETIVEVSATREVKFFEYDSGTTVYSTVATEAAGNLLLAAGTVTVATEPSSNGNIALAPDGTGKVIIDGLNWPTADGSADQVLKTDGAGNLSWVAQPTNTDTTYAVSAETATGGANLRLTGSDASTDDVKLASGTGISVSRTDANTITITNTVTDTNTTYSISAETATGGVNLRLTGSDASTDDVKLAAGSNITLTRTDASTITIASTDTSGITVTDDTTTNATRYITFEDVTSGSSTGVGVSSTKLTFNPSTGTLSTTALSGATLNQYKETVFTLTYGATITPNWNNGSVQRVTLTGNTTFAAPTNMPTGGSLTLIVYQDGTGSKTANWNASYVFAGGTPVLTTTANGVDVINIFYDGTTYLSSISRQDNSSTVAGLVINAAGELRLADSDSSNYVGFKAPATVSTNRVWTLPAADGTNGQVLSTNGSGVLSWATAGGGSGPSYAILFCTTGDQAFSSGTNAAFPVTGGWTEDYDANNIVTTSGTDFTLGAGTFIIEVSSIALYATGYGPGTSSTQLSSPTSYWNLFNVTSSTNVALFDFDIVRHPGNGSSITYRSCLGNLSIVTDVVLTGSTTFRLRYTVNAASNGSSEMRFPGNRCVTIKITKVA